MSVLDFFRRTIYLGYYIKQLDKMMFRKFYEYVRKQEKRSAVSIYFDILVCVYRYNIGIMDYFIFKFFIKDDEERSTWAGTGFMYEYHKKMNSLETRFVLSDKIEFYKAYKQFVLHRTCTIEDLEKNNLNAKEVLTNPKGKIVLKDSLGQCGWDVEVRNLKDFSIKELIAYMKDRGSNLVEEFIDQHIELAKISNSGLNTIRLITQLNNEGEVDILGARLRLSVDNIVDNLASGNIAASIDVESGIVNGIGVYSDITKADVELHPVSGEEIIGFQVPYWTETIDLAKRAALHRPENRSIGWDVAITELGPELIEGNHNWCKILWQLPVKKGMKKYLYKYM